MVNSEVAPLASLVNSLGNWIAPDEFQQAWSAAAAKATDNWLAVFFSSLPDHSLLRYFTYELQEMAALYNNCQHACHTPSPSEMVLESITCVAEALMRQFSDHIDGSVGLPAIFAERYLDGVSSRLNALVVQLEPLSHVNPVVSSFHNYLQYMIGCPLEVLWTMHACRYLEKLVKETAGLKFTDRMEFDHWIMLLIRVNFNELTVFTGIAEYFTGCLRDMQGTGEKVSFLQQRNLKISGFIGGVFPPCFPAWPSLAEMLSGWIKEELALLRSGQKAVPEQIAKLTLDLPVSHLACLTRLLQEEQVFGNAATTDILRFHSTHYRTKKQAVISAGSLNKEYYSVSQSTAARVQGLLQKMIARINRQYFP